MCRYVSKEEWPSDRYPAWAHGAGYVLSADLAAQVASGAAGALRACTRRGGRRQAGCAHGCGPQAACISCRLLSRVPCTASAPVANLPAAGAAFSASHGGRLFKLEDVALASWLEWAAERGGFRIHRVTDRR